MRAFHHALEAYKVADQLAANNVGIATFADWWGYKQEAWDAIPWNAVMAMRKGVRVAIKSDSEDYTRRLNQEAAKTIRYGGATEEEALKMITLNPAWIIGVDDRVGSIEVGKDADLVIWDGYPLSHLRRPRKSPDRRRQSTSTASCPAWAPRTIRRESKCSRQRHQPISSQQSPCSEGPHVERALLPAAFDLALDFALGRDLHRSRPGQAQSP